MDWIQSVQKAVNYIEIDLCNDLDLELISERVHSSNANFQRIFSIITGMTLGDYIRYRRLTLAGKEIMNTNQKIIDIALKYGYTTAGSFTKAFTRFHGVTPSNARRYSSDIKVFEPLSIQINVRGGFNMERKLISNVPLITMTSDNMAYITSFTGALYGVLKSLGEDFSNSQLLAYSGFGNRFCWTEDKWVFGNEDFENCNETPFKNQIRLFKDIGWKAKIISLLRDESGNLLNTDKNQIRQDFIHSINRGIPVLAQGITDDGCKHEYDVFFGYENDGKKIIGWDYYQNDDNLLIRDKWEQELNAYVLLTEKIEPSSERECMINAFKMIVDHARKKEIRGRKIGFTAWETFLNQLANDDFSKCKLTSEGRPTPPGETANNVEHRFIIYCDALAQIFQRNVITEYYKTVIDKFPEWTNELQAAIDAWEECAGYGGFLWSQGLSFDESGYEKFRDPKVRKNLADEGHKAMKKDIIAIEEIEKILYKENLKSDI